MVMYVTSLFLLINIPLLSAIESLCPAGHKSCNTSENSSLVGCCEGIAGVCCKDNIHCCPKDFACSESNQGCKRLPNFTTIPTKEVQFQSPNDIVCKDGITKCPDYTTCCPLPPGGYGCCNYSDARCCSDMTHCCPKGYDCAEGTNHCKRGSHFLSAHIILPKKTILCNDNKTMCDNEKKCCKQLNGTYACCPSGSPICCTTFCCPDDNPVCCGKYCCKECDTVNMRCKEDIEIPYITMKKIQVIKATLLLPPKRLFDFNSERLSCSVFQRSCREGCCPEKDGTCCSNKHYCCPKHFTCMSDNKCVTMKY